MKRYWTTAEYKKQQKLRLHKAQRRRRARRTRRGAHPTAKRQTTDGPILLVAPRVLNVFGELETTITFCNRLQQSLSKRQRKVAIDLSAVIRVSSDALLLIRAVIDQAKGRGTLFSVAGNMPSDPQVAAKMKESDFFRGFTNPPRGLPPPQGIMRGKRDKLVESEIAADLVQFARDHAAVSDDTARASFKTLVELMSNTHNHAESRRRGKLAHGTIDWSVCAYCENDVAHFTFVDLGVGICQSAGARQFLRRVGTNVLGYGRARLLKDVFHGLVGASLDIPGRGRGLPTMKRYTDDKMLLDLKVLTSSVAGSVQDCQFSETPESLRGTMFSWRTS